MIKGIIFDLDGTLLDSAWVWDDVDKEFLGLRGIEVPDDYPEAIAHLGFRGCAEYTIERFGFKDKPEQLMEIWDSMAREKYAKDVKIKPFVKEYLDYLKKKGMKIGVATASYEELFMPCLINNGIASYFEYFTTVAQTGKGKDTPEIYLLAAKKMGLNPSECVVFEDLPKAIACAKSAGFITVAVPDNFSTKNYEEMKNVADYIIDSYNVLIDDEFFY